jgi:hypothetical protein
LRAVSAMTLLGKLAQYIAISKMLVSFFSDTTSVQYAGAWKNRGLAAGQLVCLTTTEHARETPAALPSPGNELIREAHEQ